ncbi:MAG: hypothetical protein LC689_14120 [Myxococcales bacterium]|nr:hypothetical protein [Myxococcales bacterium]
MRGPTRPADAKCPRRSPGSFSWRWEATTDEGKTWTPQMLIDYTRHQPAH